MTVDEFLAWEERQELRHEFDGVAAKAVTGGTLAHSSIQLGLARALGNHLDGKPCRPHGSDIKVRTRTGVRYPDAFVVCSQGDPSSTVVDDPVVVFEILSRSTGNRDLGVKKLEYQSMPSVQRYVVLHQTHRAAEVFYRAENEDDGWLLEFVSGDGAMLNMPEIGVCISLAEIYKGVTLESDVSRVGMEN
jgi:Uma2 family endonuclease